MRPIRRLLKVIVVLGLTLTACGVDAPTGEVGAGPTGAAPSAPADDGSASETTAASSDDTAAGPDGEETVSVALVVNGELGDESFFDSANRGMERARDELGVDIRVIETGYEPASWEPGLRSAAASGEHDLIITGTFPMTDILGAVAADFPDQRFVFYDAGLPGVDNIYSVTYAQNEGSFLAGAFAGLATTSDELANSNPETVIGFVGGLDLPVINDFLVGYEQGAQFVDPAIEVLSAFAGDFADPARGLELATTQINQGADIVYQVAGGTGLGIIEAATNLDRYAIGVDSNQNPLAPGVVLTSMLKNVDNSLFRAIELFLDDQLPFGEVEVLGIAEGGVGLATDGLYEEHVPESIRTRMAEIEQMVESGEITVETALE
jgi:basic membrane protein A